MQLLVNWWFGFLWFPLRFSFGFTIGWFMLGSQQIQGLDRTTCLYARIFLTTQWNETWGPFRTGRVWVWQVVGWWERKDLLNVDRGLLLSLFSRDCFWNGDFHVLSGFHRQFSLKKGYPASGTLIQGEEWWKIDHTSRTERHCRGRLLEFDCVKLRCWTSAMLLILPGKSKECNLNFLLWCWTCRTSTMKQVSTSTSPNQNEQWGQRQAAWGRKKYTELVKFRD